MQGKIVQTVYQFLSVLCYTVLQKGQSVGRDYMGKTFSEMIEMYRDVVRRFHKIELNEWNAQCAVIELVKQVGELSK